MTEQADINGLEEEHVSPEPRLLTKRKVAELLAVSTRTVDRLCQRGDLEKVYLGGSVRFRRSQVLDLVEHGC